MCFKNITLSLQDYLAEIKVKVLGNNPSTGVGVSFCSCHFKNIHMHRDHFVLFLFNKTFMSSRMKLGGS